MKLPLTCVTGNHGKWSIFQNTLGDLFDLTQVPLETPELQSLDVEEVAKYSAIWAAQKLGKPVLKTDVGYFIEALNGFPGPLVKWVNLTLTPSQVLGMLEGEMRRNLAIRDALAYAEPSGFCMVTTVERSATLLLQPAKTGSPKASTFDHITQEVGINKCFAHISFEEHITKITKDFHQPFQEFGQRILARYP